MGGIPLMKLLIPLITIVLLISPSFLGLSYSIEKSKKFTFPNQYSKILYVGGDGPGNYTLIQDAIDNASDGDTVFVYNGSYIENLIVDKSINLIGENKHTTIIDGDRKGCTIELVTENVIIKNFTITRGGFDKGDFINLFRAGIRVTSSNNKIINNIIKENRLGLSGVRVTNLTIKDNIFINDGITFTPYENDKRWEIKLEYYIHNIENNTVNAKPLYYLKNLNNYNIPSDAGYIICANCTNISLKNATISDTDTGIILAYCNNCVVQNCTVTNTEGIWTLKSTYNVFEFNNLSNNYLHGIILDYSSNNNIIRYNNISDNIMVGAMLEWSKNNRIIKNNFFNNSYSGFQIQCFKNKWYRNYYLGDRILGKIPLLFLFPKIIFGMPNEKINWLLIPVNIDLFPSREPYDLGL